MSLINRPLFPEPKPRPVIKREGRGKFRIVRKYPGGAEKTELRGLSYDEARRICVAVHR